MLNLLWLLLPVAATAGWLAARRSNPGNKDEAWWAYATQFHQGLNTLLSEKGEAPPDLFPPMGDSERNAADTHLALGNLFRRRGEYDRAIRLHESLLERTSLEPELRVATHQALARAFEAAGFLERSEAAYRELIDSGLAIDEGYNSLLTLLERERDWAQAIQTFDAWIAAGGSSKAPIAQVAHYHCELAQLALEGGYPDEAGHQLAQALARDPQSARAHVMSAEAAMRDGNSTLASEHYSQVERHRPELIPDIIDARYAALQAGGDAQALHRYIATIRERRNAYSVVRSTRAIIEQLDGPEAAERFFKEQILARPSLKGLRDWTHDQLAITKPGEREKVAVICQLLEEVVQEKPAYQCCQCGFQGNDLHWRCPGCGRWDSVRAIIGAEGE